MNKEIRPYQGLLESGLKSPRPQSANQAIYTVRLWAWVCLFLNTSLAILNLIFFLIGGYWYNLVIAIFCGAIALLWCYCFIALHFCKKLNTADKDE